MRLLTQISWEEKSEDNPDIYNATRLCIDDPGDGRLSVSVELFDRNVGDGQELDLEQICFVLPLPVVRAMKTAFEEYLARQTLGPK